MCLELGIFKDKFSKSVAGLIAAFFLSILGIIGFIGYGLSSSSRTAPMVEVITSAILLPLTLPGGVMLILIFLLIKLTDSNPFQRVLNPKKVNKKLSQIKNDEKLFINSEEFYLELQDVNLK